MRLFLLGKKVVAALIVLPLLLGAVYFYCRMARQNSPAAPVIMPARNIEELPLTADAAVAMEASTGQVLYAKKPFKLRPPASTTKILTAIVAIEKGKLDKTSVVSKRAASTEESTIYLHEGETVTLEELLYGALLESGNDACVAIAEHVGGSVENFVWLMNKKAYLVGAKNTVFKNTNGLPNQEHLSTAYDMAVLARYALRNKTFAGIVATRGITIDTPGQNSPRIFSNTNRLLYSYEGADGVKTGTTNAAGECLVASATRGGRQVITVVLGSGGRYSDTKMLMEHAFNNYKTEKYYEKGDFITYLSLLGGRDPQVRMVAANDVQISVALESKGLLEYQVNLEKNIQAPVKMGQTLGYMNFYHNGYPAGQCLLVAGEAVEKTGFWQRLIQYVEKMLFKDTLRNLSEELRATGRILPKAHD